MLQIPREENRLSFNTTNLINHLKTHQCSDGVSWCSVTVEPSSGSCGLSFMCVLSSCHMTVNFRVQC